MLKKLSFALLLSSFVLVISVANAETISIPTAATTSTLYPIGAALGNLWSSKLPDIKASVQASKGGVQNLQLLSKKQAQVSFAVTSITYQAMKGLGKFKGHAYPDVRIIAGLYYNPNQIVVRKGLNINDFKELKGHSFAPGSAGSTTIDEVSAHFKAAGLNFPSDIKPQYVGPAEAGDLMRNNQTDGVWIMAGIPNAGVSEICATANGTLLNISQELFSRLAKDYPWYAPFTIPAATYPKQSDPIHTTAIKMVLITDASLSEELIYSLTKCFWENLETLHHAHSVMKQIDIKDAVTDLAGIPLHPGAEKYYRERGLMK